MKKNIFLLTLSILYIFGTPTQLTAQTPNDALRYSQTNISGTARSMGAGGAFGALGGDFSAIGINPAGLGIYRNSEVVLTPNMRFTSSTSNYLNNEVSEGKSNFNFNNVGVVFANLNRRKNEKGRGNWRAVNYAIGMNRIADFNSRSAINGYNTQSSLTDLYAQESSGIAGNVLRDAAPFGAGLAYWTYLTNPNSDDENEYVGIAANGNVDQSEYITTKKAMDEYFFAMSGNLRDKLYVGGSLSIPFARYSSDILYQEVDTYDEIEDFNYFNLEDYLDVNAVGIAAKFGLIYRINDMFRVGTSIYTPTRLSVEESYSSNISSYFNSDNHQAFSPDGSFDYDIKTPWHISLSGAVLLKKYGFVSIDYEFVDYSQMEFDFGDDAALRAEANALNNTISSTMQGAHKLRIGTEYAHKLLRARLGYNFSTSPYTNLSDRTNQSISAGIGVRDKGYFIDAAYVLNMSKGDRQPYTLDSQTVPTASINNSVGNIALTLGFKF